MKDMRVCFKKKVSSGFLTKIMCYSKIQLIKTHFSNKKKEKMKRQKGEHVKIKVVRSEID